MKNTTLIELLRFPVVAEKSDNHEVYEKQMIFARCLQKDAEQEVMYTGTPDTGAYKLLKVGEPERKIVCIDLNALWEGGGDGK